MIRSFLSIMKPRETALKPATPPAGGVVAKTVLIVDRNPESLAAMRAALADEKYCVETAESAESAFGKLSARRVDLILVDLQIRCLDGTASLANSLLVDEELASVPMVALTKVDTSRPGDSQSVGRFDGFIGKPVNALTLPDQVRRFLELSGRRPRPLAGPPPAFEPARDLRQQAARLLDDIYSGLPGSQFAAETQTGLHRLATVVGGLQRCELATYVHRAEGLWGAGTARAESRFRSMIRLCRELVDREADEVPELAALRVIYLENQRRDLESLRYALKNEDFPVLREAGHNVKGTGATYGFSELSDIGRALEAAGKAGDAAGAAVQLDRIDWYIGIVLPLPGYAGARKDS